MPQALVSRALAVFGACVVVVALAPPAVADPMDPIPGNGVFIVARPGRRRPLGFGSTTCRPRPRCARGSRTARPMRTRSM